MSASQDEAELMGHGDPRSFQCYCGKEFKREGAWTMHQHSCKSGKKRMSSALDKARSLWASKRQKLDKPERSFPPVIATSGGPSSQSDTTGTAVQPGLFRPGLEPTATSPTIQSGAATPSFEPSMVVPAVELLVPDIAEVKHHPYAYMDNTIVPLTISPGTCLIRTYNATKEAQSTTPSAFQR